LKRLLPLPFVLLYFGTVAQNYLKPNEYYHRMVNGVQVLIIEDTGATETQLLLVINSGASHEYKESPGAATVSAALSFTNLHNTDLPGFASEILLNNDYTAFYARVKGKDGLAAILKNMMLDVSYLPSDTLEIKNTPLDKVICKTDASALNESEKKAISMLYNEHDFRLGTHCPQLSEKLPNLKNIVSFKKTFYCPQNALLIIHGKVNRHELYKLLNNLLLNWKECAYTSVHLFPVGFIRTAGFNAQLVNFHTDTALISLSLLQAGPTTFNNRKEALCGLLFQSLINNNNSVNKFLKDSLKVLKTTFDYEIHKYAAVSKLTFHFNTDQCNKMLNAYTRLSYLTDSLLYPEKDIEMAKKHCIAQHLRFADSKAYITKLAQYYSTASIDYFGKLADSLNALTVKDITNFTRKYIVNNNFVAILNISPDQYHASGIDTIFTTTAAHPSAYELFFEKNTNRFIGNADSVLNSMVQWLKINPDLILKINGVATTDELLSVRDPEMVRFYRKCPQFKIMPESLIPTKNIRLDVYRSMTVIKKLHERGIPLQRLTGTGKVIRPENAQNGHGRKVYCTIRVL
jgi:predicted Zn-dependent peptidase